MPWAASGRCQNWGHFRLSSNHPNWDCSVTVDSNRVAYKPPVKDHCVKGSLTMPKTKGRKAAQVKELAFYYPGPVWHSGDWIKNLILFFDGIALLVPDYIKDKPHIVDPSIAAGLENEGLLHILEPEKIVDKAAT